MSEEAIRSINIGVLGLHNFCLGEDSVICKYDKTKADQQAGEKVADKNILLILSIL
jgi:hypothetical protein